MTKQHDHFFAVTSPGFETICARELELLGVAETKIVHGGVEFSGGLRELYLANLWLRSASRVLVRLGEVSSRDFPTLFKRLLRLPWGRFVKPGTACEIRAKSQESRLIHTGRMADVCREALVKALGAESTTSDGPQKIYLRMSNDRCVVSIDSSGDHLHRRGYRYARVVAPLRENLAAGCLLACGYDGSTPFVDLMTGSGTLAIEAALIALNRAPGKGRLFAFMDWPKYRAGLWNLLLDEARRGEKEILPAPIFGVDNNARAISAVSLNLEKIDLAHLVQIYHGNMQDFSPPEPQGLLLCNPPYGERLGKNAQLQALFHDLGQIYGERFSGWDGGLICPESSLLKSTGLSLSPVLRFSNGGIKVALLKKS